MPKKKVTPAVDAPAAPETATPVSEATPARRRKAAAPPCVTPCGDGTIDLNALLPLNGFVILSIESQRFLNDGRVVAVGDFNTLKLEVGEHVLFSDFTALDDKHIAVKFDEVVAKLDIASAPSTEAAFVDAVADAVAADDIAVDAEPDAPDAHAPVGGEDAAFEYPSEIPLTGSISVELPSPKPVVPKNAAVVNKGGKPVQPEGVRQLNKPIRR